MSPLTSMEKWHSNVLVKGLAIAKANCKVKYFYTATYYPHIQHVQKNDYLILMPHYMQFNCEITFGHWV